MVLPAFVTLHHFLFARAKFRVVPCDWSMPLTMGFTGTVKVSDRLPDQSETLHPLLGLMTHSELLPL